MSTHSYHSVIEHAASLHPSMDRPTEFIRWAEDICELISFTFYVDYEIVTEDLFAAAREAAGIEEDED
jgi:hypothetical protein